MTMWYSKNNVYRLQLMAIAFLVGLISHFPSVQLEDANKNVAIRDSLLLISTLDGTLHAVGQRSGLIKWSISDVPVLQMSPISNISEDAKHLLLPDPKDGTLYLFNGFSNDKRQKMLEKLPFTISELVSTSPCRSSDGMIYTSKKVDEWIVVDATNGEKIDIINADSPMCPTKPQSEHLPNSFESKNYASNNLLYLFKSEYQISVFNADSREKLSNFTFVDYSPSIIASIPQNSYDFVHLTSSTNGKLATIDVTNGTNSFIWSQQFSSPIVSMYKLSENVNFPVINRIPFLTIGGFINISNFFHHNSLFPSVYIGELGQSKSLYALSALVDYNQIRKDSNNLIEGPKANHLDNFNNLQVFGYYEYPKSSEIKFSIIQKSELISSIARETTKVIINEMNLPSANSNVIENYFDNYTSLLNNLIVLLILLIALCIVIPFTFVFYFLKKVSVKKVEKISTQNITIGKISYNSTDIIGRGCAGTCVYKGLFENRQQVAVKRIVADCFQLANREIELLRKLEHPNLIRYFATEHDQQFLYIAIELAEFTLAEYIEKKNILDQSVIEYDFNKADILYQSCLGLAHLHSLNIVHRDIKPQNILISMPISPNNKRKVMISDFGVSKILSSDSLTTDFSAGTEGWIASEILKSKINGLKVKASKPNDIFSMGCLIFYTYTDGEHPFGNLLNRQSNIMNGTYNLSAIKNEENMIIYSLIEPMIAIECDDRPPIEVVVKHPFFWNSKQSLQFLQDVSDRIECESPESEIAKVLEFDGIDVCRGDWRRELSIELQEDLRKFRSYKGSSVRELLRAIRNKRHHYHELDPKLQVSLGSIPNEFVLYFTSKFPRLIIHSYISLQICRHENIFQNYYHYSKNEENNFEFKILPRSGIRWYEKLKEKNDFIFQNVRHRSKGNFNKNNNSKLNEANLNIISKTRFDSTILNEMSHD